MSLVLQFAWCLVHWRLQCALAIFGSGLVWTHHPANADDAAAPLATCRVQTLPAAASADPSTAMTLSAAERPAAIIAATYRRGPTGDWIVPTNVDPDSPTVRLLLLTPSGPLLIDMSILVDGEAFRLFRERRIDEAIQSQDSGEEEVATRPIETEPAGRPAESSVERFQQEDAVVRLRNYASESAAPVSRDEARWLLAQWSPGPDLLELHPKFAADRSQRAPLWAALDTNADARLSSQEVSIARERLQGLDTNEDDWTDESELTDSPVVNSWTSFPLLTTLNDATDWSALARQLRSTSERETGVTSPLMTRILRRLDLTRPSDLTAVQLSNLLEGPPDLTLQIEFATNDTTETGVAVIALADGWLPRTELLEASDAVLSLQLSGCVVEFSAAQPPAVSNSGHWNGQIAVGAVLDGDPLLRMVDEDHDRRLSLREVDATTQALARLHHDQSGDVTLDELPVPIRLVITLGPHAHEVLAQSAAMPRLSRQSDMPAPPDWFAGMDRNKDGDLTIAEFLGTREQFDRLDTDQNDRISVAEAVKSISEIQ